MKAKDVNRKLIKRISTAYEWMPNQAYDLGSNIAHSPAPRWRNSGMAPVYFFGKRIKNADLRKIETHFSIHPKLHTYDSPKPYLNLLDVPYFDKTSNIKLLKKSGWSEIKSGNYMNIWTKPLKADLPQQFEIVHGRYFNPRLHRDFAKLTMENFSVPKSFIDDLDYLHRKSEIDLHLVVIYENSKLPVAAGLVVTVGKTSFLYCGSVLKKRRDKGLWKLLLSARQAATNTGEGHLWFLISANEYIKEKGELSFPTRSYVKTDLAAAR